MCRKLKADICLFFNHFNNPKILAPIPSKGSAAEIMPGNLTIMVIVLGGSCPRNRGDCPWGKLSNRGNGPRGVIVLVGSCPQGKLSPG